jgi:hypothetical protein
MERIQENLRKMEKMKKRVTTGVGYSGRAALRREQCDVHAVGQQSTMETLVDNHY